MGMRAGNVMSYAYALEKGTQGLIFATPIGLNTLDLAIKLSLNKLLEIMKIYASEGKSK